MRLGLSKQASQIYSSIISEGKLTVSQMAKKSGLHRYVIYKNLPELINRGLIIKSPRGKRTLFCAEPPDKLEDLVNNFLEESKGELTKLKSKYIADSPQPVIKYLKGKNEIKDVLMDIVESLKKGDAYYRYTSEKNLQKSLDYTPDKYYKLRDLKQLQRFVIGNKRTESTRDNKLDRIVKVVPEISGLFDYNIVEVMYGDKIAYIDYDTDSVIVIGDQKIAAFQKKLFKLLYDLL